MKLMLWLLLLIQINSYAMLDKEYIDKNDVLKLFNEEDHIWLFNQLLQCNDSTTITQEALIYIFNEVSDAAILDRLLDDDMLNHNSRNFILTCSSATGKVDKVKLILSDTSIKRADPNKNYRLCLQESILNGYTEITEHILMHVDLCGANVYWCKSITEGMAYFSN